MITTSGIDQQGIDIQTRTVPNSPTRTIETVGNQKDDQNEHNSNKHTVLTKYVQSRLAQTAAIDYVKDLRTMNINIKCVSLEIWHLFSIILEQVG